MEYISPPSNLIEFLVDASGAIAGTLLSLRGLVTLLLSVFIGAFRKPAWWIIPIVAAMPATLLYVLFPVWQANSILPNAQLFYAVYICVSYGISGVLGYAVGRLLRTWKHRRL